MQLIWILRKFWKVYQKGWPDLLWISFGEGKGLEGKYIGYLAGETWGEYS